MIFYALTVADSPLSVDLYPTKDLAERALGEVLHDEPGFAPLLSIVPVDLSGAPDSLLAYGSHAVRPQPVN